jgi:hypothetical protein
MSSLLLFTLAGYLFFFGSARERETIIKLESGSVKLAKVVQNPNKMGNKTCGLERSKKKKRGIRQLREPEETLDG